MGQHAANAQGVCVQNGVGYLTANDIESALAGAEWLLADDADQPRLLEVFTTMDEDQNALNEYYNQLASLS